MRGAGRALLRLFAVQGTWNYERMLGVSMGYAAEPLLEALRDTDPEHHRAAVARSAEFFNSHPYLAGAALGAAVRAEYDGVAGEDVARLRTALCGPLGAMGDQLFWAGVLPALVSLVLIAVAVGAGWWGLAGFLVAYNALRVYVAWWALRTGLDSGTGVGAALGRSRLRAAMRHAAPAATFCAAAAVPVVGGWLLAPFGQRAAFGALALAAAGVVASRLAGPRYAAPRFALTAMLLALLYRWLMP